MDPEVIVIGAGMAGLSAAQHLQTGGVNNILILEGSDKVGGRLKSIQFAGLTMSGGASWIHGLDPRKPELHPLYQLSLKYGGPLRGMFANRMSKSVYDHRGRKYKGPVESEKLEDALEDVEDHGEKLISEKRSRGVALRDVLSSNGWTPKTELDNWFEWREVDIGESCSLEKLSACCLNNDMTYTSFVRKGTEPVDYYVTDNRGFAHLAEGLKEDILKSAGTRLKFNSVVREIDWGDKSRVTVTVSNGQKYTARNVILTASIGVLKSNFIKFVPELPVWKKDVIERFGSGNYLHLIIEFSEVFWDNSDQIGYIDLMKGTYPIFSNCSTIFPEKPAVLIANLVDDQAKKVATQPKEVTLAEVKALFTKIYPGKTIEIVNAHISDWIINPLFMGSYSFFSKEMGIEDYKLLGTPVNGLLFSGEATSQQYAGYVHGGYFSGMDSAETILNSRDKV